MYKQLIESRMQSMNESLTKLHEPWKPYLDAANAFLMEKKGRGLTLYEKNNIARCLENVTCEIAGQRGKIFEGQTTESNIAFLGVQLPVITALLPSLVLNDIAVVQTLDRRTAGVFYMDIQYCTKKGVISAGSIMVSSKTGHARYACG